MGEVCSGVGPPRPRMWSWVCSRMVHSMFVQPSASAGKDLGGVVGGAGVTEGSSWN